ncbi:MAG: hypothetical protein J3K34DRAFT_262277 [Monoraphidium minutum]|nr:MAG: hypothetical protein J3K34DRAFT_262277 [Monoraphidium minutum]
MARFPWAGAARRRRGPPGRRRARPPPTRSGAGGRAGGGTAIDGMGGRGVELKVQVRQVSEKPGAETQGGSVWARLRGRTFQRRTGCGRRATAAPAALGAKRGPTREGSAAGERTRGVGRRSKRSSVRAVQKPGGWRTRDLVGRRAARSKAVQFGRAWVRAAAGSGARTRRLVGSVIPLGGAAGGHHCRARRWRGTQGAAAPHARHTPGLAAKVAALGSWRKRRLGAEGKCGWGGGGAGPGVGGGRRSRKCIAAERRPTTRGRQSDSQEICVLPARPRAAPPQIGWGGPRSRDGRGAPA